MRMRSTCSTKASPETQILPSLTVCWRMHIFASIATAKIHRRRDWRQRKPQWKRPLRIAPDLAESHLAQAQYYYNGVRDYEKAAAALAAAPPSSSDRAQFFDLAALTERRLGHWKEALRDGEKAMELDPHDPFIATEVIQSYLYLRRYAEAEKLADKAISLITDPSGPILVLKGRKHPCPGRPRAGASFPGRSAS